jgi:hypothetical protein
MLVEDFAPIAESEWGWSDYAALVASMGVEILAQEDEDGWQGDSLLILRRGDRWGYLAFGWGSCSGCDALQGCSSVAEVEELRRDLARSIVWHDSAADLLAFLDGRDWTTGYLNDDLVANFLPKARAVLVESVS